MNELNNFKKVGLPVQKKVIQLKSIVEHHVREEEGKVFRPARKILSDEEAILLKFKMHDLKGKLMTSTIKIKELITA